MSSFQLFLAHLLFRACRTMLLLAFLLFTMSILLLVSFPAFTIVPAADVFHAVSGFPFGADTVAVPSIHF
jgi:hypothetical protein